MGGFNSSTLVPSSAILGSKTSAALDSAGIAMGLGAAPAGAGFSSEASEGILGAAPAAEGGFSINEGGVDFAESVTSSVGLATG